MSDKTIYTVPLHVGQNIEVPVGSLVTFYKPGQDVTTNAQAPFLDKLHAQTVARFRLVEDDDGHWYVIPAEREEEFNVWVADMDACEDPEDIFEEFRLSGSPSNMTFTDPILEEKFKEIS